MKKILVVDDSALERELLIEILKGSGVKNEFLQAEDGDEAIELLGKNFKDVGLILLDWQMPKMSGMEFMGSVVKVPVVAGIPIIMVSASGTDENKKKAREVNIQLAGYVVKPYTPDSLLDAIKAHVTINENPNESTE